MNELITKMENKTNKKENKTLEELNGVKELAELLIEQSKDLLKIFPIAEDYIKGKIDGFNLLKDYIEDRIKDYEI